MTAPTFTTSPQQTSGVQPNPLHAVWPVLRIGIAFVFLWTFLDKTFGFGFATGRDPKTGAVTPFGPEAWIHGGSPTTGFLQFGTQGPLAPVFASIAGSPIVDWLFMLGMGGVGIALLAGVATRIATVSGIALMLTLRIAVWESPNNPIVDEQIIYALVLVALSITPAARRLSLNARWQQLSLVRRVPSLR
ncbi:hypothetical protein ACTJI8_17640 [Microbacterium sp. 22303]|uniref:hypothetical protein n=1 Tax=Microbacterium sp. 22303 TaxID=3453905 RepID=UPI003F87C4BA